MMRLDTDPNAERTEQWQELMELVRHSEELAARLQKFASSRALWLGLGSAIEPKLMPNAPLLETIETFRRLRAHYVGCDGLDDVAWDLLLELASAEHQRQRLSVSGLMLSSSQVSSTTLLRRIHELTDRGYIERSQDPNDARRHYVMLTQKGHALIAEFLERFGENLQVATQTSGAKYGELSLLPRLEDAQAEFGMSERPISRAEADEARI